MPRVVVRLFGGFGLTTGCGERIVVPERKPKALMALLARTPGRAMPRDAVAAMLWPESGVTQARANLRQALKLTRAALGPSAEVLRTEADALELDVGGVETDVVRFEAAADLGTEAALIEAAALYRGEFLEGLTPAAEPFNDWARGEALTLRERALAVFARLSDLREAAGDLSGAAEMAARLLAHDPLQEAVQRRLMGLYSRQGRRGAALKQYWACRAALARELGELPAPETEALFAEIRRSAARPAAANARRTEADRRSGSAEALFERPAIAVLPFADLSGDGARAYFAEGVSEDLNAALAAWRCFPLIASSSARAGRATYGDLRQLAESLGASYLVDGTVRRFGDRARVNVQLVESSSGHQIWTESFDLVSGDMLEAQAEAARQVAALIAPEVERAALSRIRTRLTELWSAWEHALQGRAHLRRMTLADNARARRSFEAAVALDPGYSDAFAGIALSHTWDLIFAAPTDRAASVGEARRAAERAVGLDTRSSLARLALGAAHVWHEDFAAAIVETERSVELNPSNAEARLALGNRLDLIGRPEEGIVQIRLGLRLNPLDARDHVYMGYLARAHISLGQHEAALDWARKALERRPHDPDLLFRFAICLAHLDDAAGARRALERAERSRPGFLEGRLSWRPYSDAARNERFFEGLRRHRLLSNAS